jgi:hypothetical protein
MGNPLTLTVTIAPAGLTTLGSPYTGGVAFSFGSVSVPVADPSVNVPIVINVSGQPGLVICSNPGGSPATTCGTYNWTVGDPIAAPNAATPISIILLGGPETYSVTSNQPWAVLAPLANPNSSALNSTSVSLNLAAAPTAPGTYTATITMTGLMGSEAPAVTQIVLIVAGPPSLTLTPPTGTAGTGTAGTTATPGTPGTANQTTIVYNVGSAAPAPFNVAETITSTVDNPTLSLAYGAVTYSAGASGWLALTTAPSTINDGGSTLVLTVDPTGVAPGNGYTATFTVTSSDPTGAIPANYSASVTYTVTMNVNGTLSATAANSLFTYVIGTASGDLPLSITSQPSGVTFNISTSINLAASIMTGATPNSPEITVNGVNVTTPGQATGTVTVSAPQSALNCVASATVTVSGGTCSVTVTFNLNVHPSFFQGEVSVGSGFYYLGFLGYYTYTPNQLFIYQTTLGYEGILQGTDSSRGIYLWDNDSGHIWYTSPSEYPYIYDFTLGSWLYYYTNTGNGTAGSRMFYEFLTGKIISL